VVERELAQLWKSMLAIPAVGLDDSFFSLGGDSLQAVRMLGRLREMFGVELPLRAIFDADDLRALATAIDEAQKRTAVSSGMAPQGASDLTTPLLDRLDDLSEAEIDALLQQLEGQER
jgi:acyl carrier protein